VISLKHDIFRFLKCSYLSSLTSREMQMPIYFLPSCEESDHVWYRNRADCCGGNVPNLYLGSGSSFGRLPAALISSVPAGKCQDSGLFWFHQSLPPGKCQDSGLFWFHQFLPPGKCQDSGLPRMGWQPLLLLQNLSTFSFINHPTTTMYTLSWDTIRDVKQTTKRTTK